MWTARTKSCSLIVAWAALVAFAVFAWSGAAGAASGRQPAKPTREACAAPFAATPGCRTATPKSAERMLKHPVTLRSEACPEPLDATTSCGVATVPADWAKPFRRTLEIWYASGPAPSGTSTGVTVPFMGGPGDSISEVADIFLALAAGLPDRDMLIVDVRGTGRSGRLSCPSVGSLQWRPDGQEQVDLVARCAQEIGERRNDYTTVASVLDIEAIRRALDLAKPSLLGVSYGTWVVQTYAVLFPDLVQAAVIDGILPFHLDPWSRPHPDAMQRVLRLRCERTGLCDPAEADAQVRQVTASLAAQPVPFPNSTRLLTEGAFSNMSIDAIQYAFADYLTAIDRALADDYEPLLALTEALNQIPPPNPIGSSLAMEVPVTCNEYSAPFDLGDKLSKRQAEFDRGLAALPDDAFGWFSKQGWVDSAWEQVNFCLKYPKPDFSLKLRPPYNGPFPDVPVLMLNGDIDLQTPLEMAEQAKTNWPNSVFLTIKDATHVTLQTSECSVATALSFLENPVLPDPHTCD
jgi:pimeloyl-ACP methyl ester carboxylesterase